jgi:hypothetical protein
MSLRVVNLALLFDTIVLLASGVLLFTTSRSADAWLYTLHRFAGAALLVLLVPKTQIVIRSFGRRWRRGVGFDLTTILGIVLTALVAFTLALALAWTLELLPFYLDLPVYTTPLGLHWYVAFALAPFFVWHAWKRWIPLPRFSISSATTSRPHVVSRRTALNLLGVGALAFVSLGALDLLAAATNWTRRFTWSRVVDSFEGNALPVTNSDEPPAIDIATWRLKVSGRVARPLELTYADLATSAPSVRTATLDCTLGWASTQNWRGAAVAGLLARAEMDEGARQVTCQGVTGAFVVLSVEEANDALIATHIGDEVLNDAHGFPARLVAPTRRGYHWIKWMSEVVVS